MSSSKEPSATRPLSSGSFSPRNSSSSRQPTHSVSLAAMNPVHRISRRKSLNSSAANTTAAAVAAVMQEQGDTPIHTGGHRRDLGSRKGQEPMSVGNLSNMGTYFSQPVVGTCDIHATNRTTSEPSDDDEAVVDGLPDEKIVSPKGRNRRASETSYLIKGESKRLPSELRCETCGKSYKHSSCLTKHMWEHDPAWQFTSQLLISKHQQVQLLEAASVLINMNADGSTPPAVSGMQDSEGSSASPGFSASSEVQDEPSSTETTPPPMSDVAVSVPGNKRFSGSSANFSRSYRSVHSSSFADSIASPAFPPQKFPSIDHRPTMSGIDDSGLAAAAELLNFGTPRTQPTLMSADVPPVPPLPEQYQLANRLSATRSSPKGYNLLGHHPLTHPFSDERDVKMQVNGHPSHTARYGSVNIDEDEDGMFRLEE